MDIKLNTVAVYFDHYGITAKCAFRIYGNAAIFYKIDFEGAVYKNEAPDLEVSTPDMLRDNNVVICDISQVQYNPSFIELLLEDSDQVEGQHGLLDIFKNKSTRYEEFYEDGRYLKVYIEAMKINIKATVHIVGRNICLNWFDLTEGEFGDPKDPYLTIPESVKFIKVDNVMIGPREGCVFKKEDEE